MKCKKCGASIAEGSLYCDSCGSEVQIVPDYNPLDDVLAAQVKGAISEELDLESSIQADKIQSSYSRNTQVGRRTTGEHSRDPQRNRESQQRRNGNLQPDKAQRRRQAERKKEAVRKKKKKKIMIILGVILGLLLIGFLLYQNSYTGQVKKGYRALDKKQYEKSIGYFEKAISKKPTQPEAYTGKAKVYSIQNDIEGAEKIFIDGIKNQSSNVKLYQATIQFYLDTKQNEKISILLDNCDNETVIKKLKAYVSDQPKFSLKEDSYDDVQELSLTSKGEAIYYTIDGTEATVSGTKYTEPIQLGEGDTVVKAISVNKKGVPSLEVDRKYTIEVPIEDAPAVTPSTGQYEESKEISINVPDGYTAYYTLDGTDPTENSKKYKGPINMPEGNTIFCAVLANSKGKMSNITKRNYDLTLE
ncbi:MAG: chitobiase/beta-hexosaminidase C-terminal domain-containing protein [Lachnospiraceae bacterium]